MKSMRLALIFIGILETIGTKACSISVAEIGTSWNWNGKILLQVINRLAVKLMLRTLSSCFSKSSYLMINVEYSQHPRMDICGQILLYSEQLREKKR